MNDQPYTALNADFYDFEDEEREHAATAAKALGEPLVLAHVLTGCLAHFLWHFEFPDDVKDPLAAAEARRRALLGLATLGVRTSRALILLVRNGWDAEAHALKRRLTECRLRGQHVAKDQSGEAARQWLDGRGRKANKLAGDFDEADPWALFSSGSHADARSLRLTMIPPPWVDVGTAGRAGTLMPHRVAEHAHGLLLDTASDALALIDLVAEVFAAEVGITKDLGDRLLEARSQFAERSAAMGARRERPDHPAA